MSDNVTPQDPFTERQHGAGTYEMLWDCKFCGTKKLLGVTHRHCPNCGAPQDPERRYFPTEEDMVAIENHEYVGTDVICPACRTANSAASTHCASCGADLSTGEQAFVHEAIDLGTKGLGITAARDVIAEQHAAEMARIEAESVSTLLGLRKKEWVIIGGVILVVAIIVAGMFAFTYRKDVEGSVTGLSWERVVNIDEYGPVSESKWRDQVPGDAYSMSCRDKQRSTRKVEIGSHQECKNVDQGDGSFKRECRQVKDYREEPVYDRWCSYTVDRWHHVRNVKASAADQSPYWPDYTLKTGSGARGIGKERVGDTDEDYFVHLKETGGKEHKCKFDDQARWEPFEVGMTVALEVGLRGGADCDTLKVKS